MNIIINYLVFAINFEKPITCKKFFIGFSNIEISIFIEKNNNFILEKKIKYVCKYIKNKKIINSLLSGSEGIV